MAEVQACVDAKPTNAMVKGPPPFVIDIPIQSSQLPSQEIIRLEVYQLEVYQCITDIEDRFRMIGIWGPDGIGNTHLLKKINNSFVGDSSYFVIFVKASRECSVQMLQAQIINRLEMKKDEDVATQATCISRVLTTRNFLLLVDDLYEKLDLQAVGIPYPLGTVGEFKGKVVITSRSKTVCDQMNVNKYVEVPGLGEDEALKLFAHIVGQRDIEYDSHIGALAKELVKEQKGVPSDLIHLGKQMVGKRDPREWEDVIRIVRKSNFQKKDPTLAGRTLRNLEDATSNLLARSIDVHRKIDAAERQGMISTNEVERWLKKEHAIRSEVQLIFEGNKLNKDVTMEAIEKIPEVQACLRDCPNNDNIALVFVPSVQEIPGPSMCAMNHNLERALQLIEDDPLGMIGIWGQGGVGKTYLLNSINNSIAVAGDMSFHVIFVTASRGCSVEKIQVDFIEKLGMKKDPNVESRKQTIFNFLKRRSFLVLLDDLWEKIDLQAVGVPYPLGFVKQFKRKVVITTRLRKVCGEMEVRDEINVTCMQEDEAWRFFQEKVGQRTLSSHPHIQLRARELVKELKGLPLALEVIGRAMYGKDLKRWEYAIKHMKLSRSEDMNSVFEPLKFSYDSLRNKTLRDCFLTCALWPEDWEISKVDLARCWMGLGLLDEADIESSYSKAYSLIGDLRDASLLESRGGWHGYVRMHDVIRDMALWISCGCNEENDKWFVRARLAKNERLSIPWRKAEYISLMWNQMEEFPPSDFYPCLMTPKILCLQCFGRSGRINQRINNFTSVTYLDLSQNFLEKLPDGFFSLVNLEHLDLSHNNLEEQPFHLFRNLIKLKFLYLIDCGIQTIPKGVIVNLKALQVIDLRGCIIFGEDPENHNLAVCGELGSLADLKAASIGIEGAAEYELLSGATDLPVRTLRLAELKGSHVQCLSEISSLDFVQQTLFELEIRRCRMEIILICQSEEPHFPILNRISLNMLPMLKEIKWIERFPASLFPMLTCLDVRYCVRLEHLSWVMNLRCLERLDIVACNNMKEAFLKPIPDGTFSCLKHLRLSNNIELATICDPDVPFPSLEKMMINGCSTLERLPFQMHNLPKKLQVLLIDTVESWEKLRWEEGVKSFLQPALKFGITEPVSFGVIRDWK
ncbi:unnamed protein product [Alopecurus aequalis]